MTYNFDAIIERHGTDSAKWSRYAEDTLPMWVADMDFVSPEPILQVLHQRIDHGVFGYVAPPERLREVICERMARLYNWGVTPDQVSFLPGLVCGLNVLCRAIGEPGDGVLVNTPVYMPFLSAPVNQGRILQDAQLSKGYRGENGQKHLHYEIDFDALEGAITEITKLFILCNPHNPIGRSYTVDELTRLAEMCNRHNLVLCSDEIHSDLCLGDTKHIPIASLSPEIAERTITLLAPSKTFNLPGLGCSAAIIQNQELRQRMDKAASGIVPHVNVMGYTAALAAYTQCQDWLDALLSYLTANRDFLVNYIDQHLPEIQTTVPESTYLAWLDCHTLGHEDVGLFCQEEARIGLSSGPAFGAGGEGFVRMNFGCPRATLEEGLNRLRDAIRNSETTRRLDT